MNYRRNFMILVSFTIMFSMAITSGIRGLLVPSFMNYFDVTAYQIGLLLSVTTAVSVVAAFITAPISNRIGYKMTIILGLIINITSFLFAARVTDFLSFTLLYCAITIGVTFSLTSLNTVVTVIKVPFQAVLVNMIHFFFGLGITFSQKFGGDLIVLGYHWQDFFTWMAYLLGFCILLAAFVQYPSVSVSSASNSYRNIPNMKFVAMVCLALGLYVSAELQTGNWMINYLNKTYGYTEAHAGIFAAVFFGTFSIGRFLGGFIAERIGYIRSVITFMSAATILFITGMALGESGLWVLASSGFFFSLVFPTMTLFMADLYPKQKATIISLISTICNFLALVSSYLMGVLNDRLGTGLAFWLIPVCLAGGTVLFIFTLPKAPKANA